MPMPAVALHRLRIMLPYERLTAWTECHRLVLETYRVTEFFPRHEIYGLRSQARRAAFSAAVNIAEGSAKRGRREFRRFLDISLGSLVELSYALRVGRELGMIGDADWDSLEDLRKRAGFLTWRLYRSMNDEGR